MPSPNEMQVLRIVQDAKKVNKFTISRRMEITTIYANYLLATLAVKGYLKKDRQGKFGVYTVTPKSLEALAKIHLVMMPFFRLDVAPPGAACLSAYLKQHIPELIKYGP